MKKVIINADDFGLTKGCNNGIIKGMTEGIITSTTIMMNMPESKHAIELAKAYGIKDIGIHLTLTCGAPLSEPMQVPSLVNTEGKFYSRRWELFPKIKKEDAEKELRNQIETFLSYGIQCSHFDSHHHVHMYEEISEVVLNLAKEYNVALRQPSEHLKKRINEMKIPTTDCFSMEFYGEKATLTKIKSIIGCIDDETIEIMTHPAYPDDELFKISSYNSYRQNELDVLMSKNIKNWLDENDIELVGFLELMKQ